MLDHLVDLLGRKQPSVPALMPWLTTTPPTRARPAEPRAARSLRPAHPPATTTRQPSRDHHQGSPRPRPAPQLGVRRLHPGPSIGVNAYAFCFLIWRQPTLFVPNFVPIADRRSSIVADFA